MGSEVGGREGKGRESVEAGRWESRMRVERTKAEEVETNEKRERGVSQEKMKVAGVQKVQKV